MRALGPQRPVLLYHGGKFRLRHWIIRHFPEHRIYAEAFAGAASVLLAKRRAFTEVLNDLDDEVVNLFRVLRDPIDAASLRELVELTPWSRTEFFASYEPATAPIERARRLLVRCWMGFGTTGRRRNRTGFRATAWRRGTSAMTDWVRWPDCIPAVVERLRGVTIENRPALEIIRQQDTPDTLFYLDPPYVQATRTSLRFCASKGGKSRPDTERCYAHDLTDQDHAELAAALHEAKGTVILSGYPSDLYDRLYGDWHRVVRSGVMADAGTRRVEVLWSNRPLRDHLPERPGARGSYEEPAELGPSLFA